MSEYKELIKQFDKIRAYVRDFYIYGFKTREDFREKSGRTYDNHRRRLESWFSGYIRAGQNGHKKAVFLTLDSSRMAVNPLYQAWKSKTFTDNDISLRFFLPDLLFDGRPRNLETIADEIQEQYHCLFDTQTIRRKLAFYEKEGLVTRKKEGKQYLYSSPVPLPRLHPDLFPALWLCVSFFQGVSPFGFLGSAILDFWDKENPYFRFRNDYLIHTLEDEILLSLLRAMEQKRQIRMTIKSAKSRRADSVTAAPLKILTSTQTGRRYLCARQKSTRRLSSFRLDSIQDVELLDPDPDYDVHQEAFRNNFPYVWGVSFGSPGKRQPETVSMEVCLDEQEEEFILNRLKREGRGGSLRRLSPGVYEYTRLCTDAAELLFWAKSFTGRIRSFRCSNPVVEKRFRTDMQLMQSCYLATEEESFHGCHKPAETRHPAVRAIYRTDGLSAAKHDSPLFCELYTCYYQITAKILEKAALNPLTSRQMEELARKHGYDESALSIVPRLLQGDWPFLEPVSQSPGHYTSVLKHPLFPRPLTRLQKSWLKSLMSDSRFSLFFTDDQLMELKEFLSDVPPLYRTSDFCLFDQYGDHDPFSSVMYREHMHTILEGLCGQCFLSVSYLSRKGNILTRTCLPCRLEYGQKDGKFRLYGMSISKNNKKRMDVLNVARILSVRKTNHTFPFPVDVDTFLDYALCKEPLVLEITNQRNALERAMLHFSCYQKKVERLEDPDAYRCTIYYDKRWETELLIQVLSFGPVIKVLGPESFLEQIKNRVRKQAFLQETANFRQ